MISDRNLSAATAGPIENPTLHTQAMRETLTMEISTGQIITGLSTGQQHSMPWVYQKASVSTVPPLERKGYEPGRV